MTTDTTVLDETELSRLTALSASREAERRIENRKRWVEKFYNDVVEKILRSETSHVVDTWTDKPLRNPEELVTMLKEKMPAVHFSLDFGKKYYFFGLCEYYYFVLKATW